MFTTNDILEKLRAGVSADDLAKEFANALNDAETARTKELEAEKAAKATNTRRIAYMRELVDDITAYISEFHADILKDQNLKINELLAATDEECLELADTFDEYLKFMSTFTNLIKMPAKEKTTSKSPVDIGEIFASFFSENNI